MTHTVHMSIPPLVDAIATDLLGWALRVRSAAGPPQRTIRCTVEQADKIVAEGVVQGTVPVDQVPVIEFGMESSIFGLPVEWVVDSTESTFFEGRTMVTLDNVRKLSAVVPVSAELLNLTPPDPAESARWRAELAAGRSREDTRHAELLAAGGVVAAVAALHAPDHRRECGGCDFGGFDAEAPEWPCRTWQLLDETVPR